eukprot:5580920-Amphidinium_carterae.1
MTRSIAQINTQPTNKVGGFVATLQRTGFGNSGVLSLRCEVLSWAKGASSLAQAGECSWKHKGEEIVWTRGGPVQQQSLLYSKM